MAEYRVSARARSQLLDIYDFSVASFGVYQAEAYIAGLERTFGLLANFPHIGQLVEELAPALHRRRSSRVDPSYLSSRPGHRAASFRLTFSAATRNVNA